MQNQSFIIQKNTVDNFFKMERNIRLLEMAGVVSIMEHSTEWVNIFVMIGKSSLSYYKQRFQKDIIS